MPDFSKRSEDIEIMDDLQCSGEVVNQTLRELEVINAWLGGNQVTIDGLEKLLDPIHSLQEITIIDVGCGGGDMLRLNMAVPPTPRNDPKFSSLGIVSAAVLGLTDTMYNKNTSIQMIPNMDGFPNGRRLEDDVTTIELQAVSGVALAAIGLWYDDYSGMGSPVTANLVKVLSFTAGPTKNDTTFQSSFPYVQQPWASFRGASYAAAPLPSGIKGLSIGNKSGIIASNYPNPFNGKTTIKYNLSSATNVSIDVIDINGKRVATLIENEKQNAGIKTVDFEAINLPAGIYFAQIATSYGNTSVKMIITK